MSIARLELVLRLVGGVLVGVAAWEAGRTQLTSFLPFLASWTYLLFLVPALLAVVGFVLGFRLTPYLTTRPFFWLLHNVTSMPVEDILVSAGGFFVGLLIGVPLIWPLSLLPLVGLFLPTISSLVLGYLGMRVFMRNQKEVLRLLFRRRDADSSAGAGPESTRVLVDTSAVIDGRIADIAAAGFMPGPLVVPRFVLHELQRVADSPDPLRRARGRHGFEILERLGKSPRTPLEILEADGDDGQDVDAQLMRLAKSMRAAIATTDFNLNRHATIARIAVLNVNELANAVKSLAVPGEELALRILQEGKEYGQGIGYLPDGTMVVVENGRRHLQEDVTVVVQRVLQKAEGRMIFAQLKAPREGRAAS